jgi:hypothetical protein
VTLIRPDADSRAAARPHPDPQKRLEALLAMVFRPWLRKEFPVPPEGSASEQPQPVAAVRPAEPVYPPRQQPIAHRTPRETTAHPALEVPMIHHAFILDAGDKFVVNEAFWDVDIDEGQVDDFASRVRESQDVIIEEKGPTKYIGKPLGRSTVILCAGTTVGDDILRDKLERVTDEFRRVVNDEVEYDDFVQKVDDYVTIDLKVSIIGYGGAGREEIVTLLNSGVPLTDIQGILAALRGFFVTPTGAQRMIGSRIGALEISTMGFEFEGYWSFRKLWELYFRGSRIILLVTDSTLKNVLNTKDIVDLIRRKEIIAEVLAIANYQDRPGALSPALVQRMLGVKTLGLRTADLRSPNATIALKILTEALCSSS